MVGLHDLKDIFQPELFYHTPVGKWSSDGSLGQLFGVTPGSGDQATPQFLSQWRILGQLPTEGTWCSLK